MPSWISTNSLSSLLKTVCLTFFLSILESLCLDMTALTERKHSISWNVFNAYVFKEKMGLFFFFFKSLSPMKASGNNQNLKPQASSLFWGENKIWCCIWKSSQFKLSVSKFSLSFIFPQILLVLCPQPSWGWYIISQFSVWCFASLPALSKDHVQSPLFHR